MSGIEGSAEVEEKELESKARRKSVVLSGAVSLLW